MKHNESSHSVNPALAAAIDDASKAFARLLTIAVQPTAPAVDDDLPIPLDLLVEHFPGTSRSYWRTRVQAGDIPGVRLARQKIGVRPSDARACIEAHPAKFKPRKVVDITDPIERKIASGELVRGRK
jgi:hypothetical protein